MIKFYLDIQNKILTRNILLDVLIIVMVFNIMLVIKPELIINFNSFNEVNQQNLLMPTELFIYCDIYMVILFVIMMFFSIGGDFNNSVYDITLAIGGSKTNKFVLKKIISMLLFYACIYLISYINIYRIFLENTSVEVLEFSKCLFLSSTSIIFIISVSLFLIYITKSVILSSLIVISYYFVEEYLWTCRLFQEKGILSHIYFFTPHNVEKIYTSRIEYIAFSIILLFITYLISKRKKIILALKE